VMLDCNVEVFQFIVPELANYVPHEGHAGVVRRKAFHFLQLTEAALRMRVLISKRLVVLIVVLADDGLDRLRACHGGLLAHERGGRPQTETTEFGRFREYGGPYPMLELHLVEHGEVFLLLVPHFLLSDVIRLRRRRECRDRT
jgi:hypothetical protein